MEHQCYCKVCEISPYMLPCQECKKRFHLDCLKSGRPSSLMCDAFFKFICEDCSSSNSEQLERLKLPWTKVVILSIFNLQLEGKGKCGFFHWRDHICSFIDKNWALFFGSKKKTNTWQGTVAGTLSSGCPKFFKSGLAELGESGWWALTTSVPEMNLEDAYPKRPIKGPRLKKPIPIITDEPMCQGLRAKPKKNAIQAAIELKERRSSIPESRGKRSKQKLPIVIKNEIPSSPPQSSSTMTLSHHWSSSIFTDNNSNHSISSMSSNSKYRIIGKEDEKFITNIKSEPPDAIFSDCSNNSFENNLDIGGSSNSNEPIAHCSNANMDSIYHPMDFENIGNEEEIKIDDDATNFTMNTEVDINSMLSYLDSGANEHETILPTTIEEKDDDDNEDSLSSNQSDTLAPKSLKTIKQELIPLTPNDKHKKTSNEVTENRPNSPRCKLMTEYDEKLILQRLEKLSGVIEQNKGAQKLYRKLLVREKNRNLKRPVFDLDAQYQALSGCEKQSKENTSKIGGENVIDRYQAVCPSAQGRTHSSFVTRLLGFEDDQLESIISPYTMRTLKPFIFRDYESVPLKVKLLREIVAHSRKKKGDTVELPKWPIDYCYVKPHHIPVVNSMCREFFWPGIDLSECLQYPDFSCVVLYRKVIVAFAFMVPDVKYNEAYISFVFTHPEWRNAGIATFMIYHLIQTCMGKDVTLHVSVTNPACFLYQKFGFKVEEVFLDFYNKYLPLNSNECRHALFMRLSR